MNLVLGGVGDVHACENDFKLLDEHALDFEEVRFVLDAEFAGAGEVDELVELLPALEVVLGLLDQWSQFCCAHGSLVCLLTDGINTFGDDVETMGARKTMAPPRISRAVMRRLG
jgi:hypothetical protein